MIMICSGSIEKLSDYQPLLDLLKENETEDKFLNVADPAC
jgi:hypothetical protein